MAEPAERSEGEKSPLLGAFDWGDTPTARLLRNWAIGATDVEPADSDSDVGTRLVGLARRLGVSDWTLYRWCKGIHEPQGLYEAALKGALIKGS